MTAPAFGSIVKGTTDGWEGVPDGPNPFYVGFADGLYVHKRSLLGRGMAKLEFWPEEFKKFGLPTGGFIFEADPIPASLMGQVVNFFERIYDRQHTEAAVLLIMHAETKQWRVFVPTQLVSHGGVNYVFDPLHIRYPWVIVGSIHSHCDFGAGHSSTDTGDATNFDGLHMTIGHIKRHPAPEIVAMMAMNKRMWNYGEAQFPKLFDWTEARAHQAPAWWDRYVEDTNEKVKPVGFELYKKFDRPTIIKTESKPSVIRPLGPTTQPQPNKPNFISTDWVWNEKLSRMVHKNWVINEDGTISYPTGTAGKGQHGLTVVGKVSDAPGRIGMFERLRKGETIKPAEWRANGYEWDSDLRSWRWTGGSSPHAIAESRMFNARREAERGVRWDGQGRLVREDWSIDAYGMSYDRHWEDSLGEELLDAMFDSLALTDDDIDFAIENPTVSGDAKFWQELFYKKALGCVRVLQASGLEAKLQVKASEFEQLMNLLGGDKPPADYNPRHDVKGTI